MVINSMFWLHELVQNHGFKQIDLFLYLFEGEGAGGERERERESSIHRFTPPGATMVRTVAGRNREPGTFSGFLLLCKGAQTHGQSSAAFPGQYQQDAQKVEQHGSRIGARWGCCHDRQWIYVLCSTPAPTMLVCQLAGGESCCTAISTPMCLVSLIFYSYYLAVSSY